MSPLASLVSVAAVAAVAAAAAPTNICGSNTTIGLSVINSFNLTYPGLANVSAYVSRGDLNGACEALAYYYQTSNSSAWLRIPPVTPGTGRAGGIVDEMVNSDIFFLYGVGEQAKVPRNADGGLDWLFKGPNTDVEFMNCLNRHDSFTYLLTAWIQTGNPIYEAYFNALVEDWSLHNPCPNALSGGEKCGPIGAGDSPNCSWVAESPIGAQACATGTFESPWRSLEMGIRLTEAWPVSFFGFQQSSGFSTSARVLFLLAVSEHFSSLAVDGGHPGRGTVNWEITQWSGLINAVVTWPEINNASRLLALALTELEGVFDEGVYMDGVETEMASGYDIATAGDFYRTLAVLAQAGDNAPPASFYNKVESMWNYGAFISDPAGCLPRNGDSDLCSNGYQTAIAAYFNRSDWTYVHTNGAEGTVPAQLATTGPSNLFEWSGQMALRSGYETNSSWLWFDVGPYGSSGHAHRDKLQIMLNSRGSMLLVDSGRFAYAGDDFSALLHKQYADNTTAHNTITIEGCDQLALPPLALATVPAGNVVFTPLVDTAWGNMSYYDGLVGKAVHTRAVYFQRTEQQISNGGLGGGDGDFAVVVDILTSDRPRSSMQATWHTHPNSSAPVVNSATGVAVVGGAKGSTGHPTSAQVCVIPAAATSLVTAWSSVDVIRGQNATSTLRWQGWYSQAYDDAWASSTLVYEATNLPQANSYFAWLLIPTAEAADCSTSSVTLVEIGSNGAIATVQVMGQPAVNVTVPFTLPTL